MATIFVKPAAGRRARHPETGRPLSATGEHWPDTPYLRRRLRDGDVVPANAPRAGKKSRGAAE